MTQELDSFDEDMKRKFEKVFFKLIPSIIFIFIVATDNYNLGFQYKMTPAAYIYLTKALNIIQENYYKKKRNQLARFTFSSLSHIYGGDNPC